MRKKKERPAVLLPDQDQTESDPFFRRIKVQSTIIKKMLAEIDLPPATGSDPKKEKALDQKGNV